MKKDVIEDRPGHWSDCAIYGAPAFEPGECDCGGLNLAAYDSYRLVTSLIPTPGSLARFVENGELPSSIHSEDTPGGRTIALAPPAHLPSSHDGITRRAGADGVDLNDASEAPVSNSETLSGAQRLTRDVPPHKQPPRSTNGPTDKGGSQ